MKNFSIVAFLIIAIVIATMFLFETPEIKTVQVYGDLTESFDIKQLYALEPDLFQKINYKETKMMAIEGSVFLEKLPKVYPDNDIYLISNDGFMNKIEGETLVGTHIGYSEEYGWVFESEKHPPNSGVRQIQTILVVKNSKEINHQYGLNIINVESEVTYHFSIGELYLKPYKHLNYLDGISEKTVEGITYKVPGMKIKKVLQIGELIDESFKMQLMMTSEGDYEYFASDGGYIELSGHQLNYIVPETFNIYNDLKGIIINPPTTTVMDTYDEVIHSLKQDENIMVIFMDGFSYTQYTYMKNNLETYLNTLTEASVANTIFKPVTNAGFAAMITGETPKVNGVLNRSYRELNTPDIFEYALGNNLEAILIEGDINILDTTLKPILNIDRNGNNMADDEIYETTMKALESDYDLMMIHLHSLDEMGHDYGPLDKKTIEQLLILDGYIEDFILKWDGKVIITTDHGMHKVDDAGDHGEFRYEDMIVPYISIKQ